MPCRTETTIVASQPLHSTAHNTTQALRKENTYTQLYLWRCGQGTAQHGSSDEIHDYIPM